MRFNPVLAAAVACVLIAGTAIAREEAPDGYRLVWADEFEKDGKLDDKRWTYEKGFVRNNELQWYQKENAFCRKGFLIIEGRREAEESVQATPLHPSEPRDRREQRRRSAEDPISLAI